MMNHDVQCGCTSSYGAWPQCHWCHTMNQALLLAWLTWGRAATMMKHQDPVLLRSIMKQMKHEIDAWCWSMMLKYHWLVSMNSQWTDIDGNAVFKQLICNDWLAISLSIIHPACITCNHQSCFTIYEIWSKWIMAKQAWFSFIIIDYQ